MEKFWLRSELGQCPRDSCAQQSLCLALSAGLASLCVTCWETFFFFPFLITLRHEKIFSVYGSETSLTLNLELAGKEHAVTV